MNQNLNLNLDFKKINVTALLGALAKYGPMVVTLALAGLFGYTGWEVNRAFNVAPSEAAETASTGRITFDQATIESVKNLRVVPGQVSPGDVGKTDPFTP